MKKRNGISLRTHTNQNEQKKTTAPGENESKTTTKVLEILKRE